MKKSLMALAMSLAAVSGAHASWFSGYNAGDVTLGNGEAIFVAFDDVAGESYVQDLGVRYDDLVSGAAFNGQSFGVDLSVFSNNSAANVRWTIMAGSGQYFAPDFSAAQYTNYGLISSFDVNANPVVISGQTTFVSNALGAALAGIDSATAMYNGAVTDNASVTESVAFGPKFVGNTDMAAFVNQQTSQDALGAITGETMNLWRYGFTDIDGNSPIVNKLGSITLAGSSLTLNTGVAPEVPVPAAVWLLGSALAGLGGIARRRNKAA